jgi:PPOX class probable F420-dependent enzyme
VPRAPVPDAVAEFLARPNPAVVATLRPDGFPHTAATWYAWEDGRFLVNMDETRRRLEYLRRDPRVSLTALSEDEWYHQVTVMGEVASIEPDPDLRDIDRLSTHYSGQPFSARHQKRWSAWVEVDRWFGWDGGSPWPPRNEAS